MTKPPKELVGLLEESLRFSRDHLGEKYRHTVPCEWCLQQGLCYGIAHFTGQTMAEVRAEYKAKIDAEKKPRTKAKVVRRRPIPGGRTIPQGPYRTVKIVRKKK